MAVTPDGTKVYVANFGIGGFLPGATVSVIDTSTDTVIATIPIDRGTAGAAGSEGVAVSPDSSKVYVANNSAYTVSVIATSTNTVTATIPIACCPFGVAVSPDGTKVYLTSDDEAGDVSVIDTATNAVNTTIHDGGVAPFGVAVSPDGTKVYAANILTSNVSVIDAATNTVTATVPVGNFPYGVAVTPDGGRIYVANSCVFVFNCSNTVSVIDAATNTVIDTIPGFTSAIAFGKFIQPALKFAGTPGTANCLGQSVSTLGSQYGGLNAAAAALGYPSVRALQEAIMKFCEG